MPKEKVRTNLEQDAKAEFSGGSIEYSVLEKSAEHNPVLVVPGFTEGRFVLNDFAHTLSDKGERTVIFPDQPEIDWPKAKLPIVDHHAEALLAMIEAQDLTDKPVDVIAHSFGAITFVRAAELAKERGYSCFDSQQGSRSVFLAPAGSNSSESLPSLGMRYVNFLSKSMPYGKELDPSGAMMKAGTKNFFADPAKTSREIISLGKKESIYKVLGKASLRPFILGYAADDLYPHRTIEQVFEENIDALSGYAVAVGGSSVGAGSFEEFKNKTGLAGKDAKRAWAHHHRNASHNDWLFHPERTVDSVLQIFNQPLPKHL